MRELGLKKNLEQKQVVVQQIKSLAKEQSIKQADFFLRKYLDEWSNIGPVPRESKQALLESFQLATREITSRIKSFYDKLHDQQKQNLELKNALCLEVEQINLLPRDKTSDWQEATDRITRLREEWKHIGFAPRNANHQVWHRFNSAINKFFEQKRLYFGELKEQAKTVKTAKMQLLQRATEIAATGDLNAGTDEIKKLQQQWRELGSGTRDDFRLWKKFREQCDLFFQRKKEQYSSQLNEQTSNLELKRNLVERVKQYSSNGDRQSALATLKDFSEEWDSIGHVPFKEKDKIFHDFRTALDEKYKLLQVNARDREHMQFAQRVEKLKTGGADAGKTVSKEIRFLKERIDQLRQTVSTYENNLGFFGKSNSNKVNPLKLEVESKLAKTREELNALLEKLSVLKTL
jgi:hypothetical protein